MEVNKGLKSGIVVFTDLFFPKAAALDVVRIVFTKGRRQKAEFDGGVVGRRGMGREGREGVPPAAFTAGHLTVTAAITFPPCNPGL